MAFHPRARRALVTGIALSIAATAIIAVTASRLAFDVVGPGKPFEYPWRLVEPNPIARVSAWVLYALHNLAAWGLIAWAKARKTPWTDTLSTPAVLMGALHVVFIALHWGHTHLVYDALAQDVHELTALGSVALMLMVILILDSPRRGLLVGKKPAFAPRFMRIVRGYHGYFFTWAIIYTFWYHPMEATPGHLVGFFYMFMLLVQSALMYSRMHVNRFWTLTLELLVVPHGVVVAMLQPSGMWPMFLFGFGAVFVLTQMYGLRLGRTAHIAITGAFLVGVLAVYGSMGRLAHVHEVLRIPLLDYGVVALLYGLFLVVNAAWSRFSPQTSVGPDSR